MSIPARLTVPDVDEDGLLGIHLFPGDSDVGNRRDLVWNRHDSAMTLYCRKVDPTQPGEHDDHR